MSVPLTLDEQLALARSMRSEPGSARQQPGRRRNPRAGTHSTEHSTGSGRGPISREPRGKGSLSNAWASLTPRSLNTTPLRLTGQATSMSVKSSQQIFSPPAQVRVPETLSSTSRSPPLHDVPKYSGTENVPFRSGLIGSRWAIVAPMSFASATPSSSTFRGMSPAIYSPTSLSSEPLTPDLDSHTSHSDQQSPHQANEGERRQRVEELLYSRQNNRAEDSGTVMDWSIQSPAYRGNQSTSLMDDEDDVYTGPDLPLIPQMGKFGQMPVQMLSRNGADSFRPSTTQNTSEECGRNLVSPFSERSSKQSGPNDIGGQVASSLSSRARLSNGPTGASTATTIAVDSLAGSSNETLKAIFPKLQGLQKSRWA